MVKLLRVTDSQGVIVVRIPKNTKFTIVPFYRVGRVPSNHRSKKTASVRAKRLTIEKISFTIFDEKLEFTTLKELLYD